MKKLLIPLLCLCLLLGGCAASRPTDAVTAFYASLYPDQTITRAEDGSIRISRPEGEDLTVEARDVPPVSTEDARCEIESVDRMQLYCRVWNESDGERAVPRISTAALYVSLEGKWWPVPLMWNEAAIQAWLQPGESLGLPIPLTYGWQELPAGEYRLVHGGELPCSLDFSLRRGERGDSVNGSFPIPEANSTDLEPKEEAVRFSLQGRPEGWADPQLRLYRSSSDGRKIWHFSDTGGDLKLSWRELNETEVQLLQEVQAESGKSLQRWEQDFSQRKSAAAAYLKTDAYDAAGKKLSGSRWYVVYAESPGRDYEALAQLLDALQVCIHFWPTPLSGYYLPIVVPG